MGLDRDFKKIIKSYKENWDAISADPNLSEAFIEEFADKLNWRMVSNRATLSEAFIEKHIDRLDMSAILSRQKVSEAFLRKNMASFKWNDWKALSACQKLSEKFILEFADKINWTDITAGQDLSEEFMEKYADKIRWEYVARYQRISEEFYWKHKDKLEISFLLTNKKTDVSTWSNEFQQEKKKQQMNVATVY